MRPSRHRPRPALVLGRERVRRRGMGADCGRTMAATRVHLVARVMVKAGTGQVLVSTTVRELLAGSGLGFVDLGVRELKGLPRAGGCSAFGSCLSVAGAASRLWQRRWRPGQGFASACSLKICCPR
jgi:hypothetical protein